MIHNALLISFNILGFYIVFDYLLSHYFDLSVVDVYNRVNNKILITLMKPIFVCPTCMSSVHGSIWYLLLNKEYFIHEWLMTLFIVAFFNTVFFKVYQRI